MKRIFKNSFPILWIFVIVLTGFCKDDFLFNTIFVSGDEVRIPINNTELSRVNITLKNKLKDSESSVMRSSFLNGNELGNGIIGPEEMRTYKLKPSKDNKNDEKQSHKKVIVVDTEGLDEILIKVLLGEVSVSVKEEKEKIKKNDLPNMPEGHKGTQKDKKPE